MKNNINYLIFLFFICFYFTACIPRVSSTTQVNPPFFATNTITPKTFFQPTNTKKVLDLPIQTETTSPIDELSGINTCIPSSPLKSIEIEELNNIVSNPYQKPTIGQDDGHHGVDFSFYSYHAFESIDNLPVLSILTGKISAIIKNRPPYGNAVIIETDLTLLEENILSKINQLGLSNEINTSSYLNCPAYSQSELEDATKNDALYVLYGHLKSEPDFEIGDEVKQGQPIGNVGNTGYSGNSHLHLETRIGPSNATLKSLAHYDNSVSLQEMKNYCLWRVSNLFSLFDPLLLFEKQPTKP